MKYIIELEKEPINVIALGEMGTVKTVPFTEYHDPTEHDWCGGCKHSESYYSRCVNCSRNPSLTDHYEAKPKKTIKRWEKYDGDFVKASSDFMKTVCKDCDICKFSEMESVTDCYGLWLMEDIEVDE